MHLRLFSQEKQQNRLLMQTVKTTLSDRCQPANYEGRVRDLYWIPVAAVNGGCCFDGRCSGIQLFASNFQP